MMVHVNSQSCLKPFSGMNYETMLQNCKEHVSLAFTDGITEAWIDFTCAGYEFTINDQFGEYWFFVNDATCPDNILRRVESHFGKVLDKDKIHR